MITIMGDWLTSKVLRLSRTVANIQKVMTGGYNDEDTQMKVTNELNKYKISRINSTLFGSELATVAISLDFTALGIWIYNKDFFPFFSSFNSDDIKRDVMVWFVVIFIHIVLFLTSTIFKHLHFDNSPNSDVQEIPSLFSSDGFKLMKWGLSTNLLGFVTLLSSIVIFTNAIK